MLGQRITEPGSVLGSRQQRAARRHGSVCAVAVTLPSVTRSSSIKREDPRLQALDVHPKDAAAQQGVNGMPWDNQGVHWIADHPTAAEQRPVPEGSSTQQASSPHTTPTSQQPEQRRRGRPRSKPRQPASPEPILQEPAPVSASAAPDAKPTRRRRSKSKAPQQDEASTPVLSATNGSTSQLVAALDKSASLQPAAAEPDKPKRGRARKKQPTREAASPAPGTIPLTVVNAAPLRRTNSNDHVAVDFVPSQKMQRGASSPAPGSTGEPDTQVALPSAVRPSASRARSRTPSAAGLRQGGTQAQDVDTVLAQMSGSSTSGIPTNMYSARVLGRQEERELAVRCQDLMGIEVAVDKLRGVLRRQPSLQEVAHGMRTTPEALSARLALGVSAKHALIAHNKRLVAKLAGGIHASLPASARSMCTKIDLVEEGMKGLMNALRKFEPDSGFKLSTYATFWIKQSMYRSIQQQGSLVTVSSKVYEDAIKVSKVQRELTLHLGRSPDFDELRQALSWTPGKLQQVLDSTQLSRASSDAMSIESSMSDEDDGGTLLTEMLASGQGGAEGEEGIVTTMGGTDSGLQETWLVEDVKALITQAVSGVVPSPERAQLVTHIILMRLGFVDMPVGTYNTTTTTDSTRINGNGSDSQGDSMDSILDDSESPSPRGSAAGFTKLGRQRGLTPLRVVGEAVGLSFEAVRLIERKVLGQLRDKFGTELDALFRGYAQIDARAGMAARSAPGASKKA